MGIWVEWFKVEGCRIFIQSLVERFYGLGSVGLGSVGWGLWIMDVGLGTVTRDDVHEKNYIYLWNFKRRIFAFLQPQGCHTRPNM